MKFNRLAFVIASCAMWSAQAQSSLQAPHVDAGAIQGSLYEDHALGIRLPIPKGWDVSQPTDFSGAEIADGSLLPRCAQPLLSIKRRSSKTGFVSTSELLAINPQCLPNVSFPKENEQPQVFGFAQELLKIFKGTVYVPPSGVDVGGQHISKHQFVFLGGSGFRGADATSEKKNIHVNTMISITESMGYWIA